MEISRPGSQVHVFSVYYELPVSVCLNRIFDVCFSQVEVEEKTNSASR